MPHSSTTTSFNHDNLLSPIQRFLCPIETCRRACKSKAAWTRHLRSVHAHIDLSKFQSQNPIIDLPQVSSPTRRHALSSLPTSPVTPNPNDAHTDYDFEMEPIEHDAAGSDFHPDLRSSPSHNSEAGDCKEYHPIINGEFLFDFGHSTPN